MEGSSKLKVPGGKLIIIKLTYTDRIKSIQILGDFFIHPEESLDLVEKLLVGIRTDSSREEIAQKIDAIVKQKGAEMVGITPDAIAEAIKMAIK